MILLLLVLALSSEAYAQQTSCEEYRRRYSCPNNETYAVHLTFDDGPMIGKTDKVLDALQEHNVPATFFVVADRLGPGNPEEHFHLIRRIQREGHKLASHSYHHHAHTELTDDSLTNYVELSRTHGHDWEVNGEVLGDYLSPPPMFRLPYGDGWHKYSINKSKKARVMEVIAENGFSHIGWDFHAWDWDREKKKNPGVLHYLMNGICEKGGGIALLHDIQSNTADNIGEWIRAMKCVGHRFDDIDDYLISNDVVQMCESTESPMPGTENFHNEITKVIPHVH